MRDSKKTPNTKNHTVDSVKDEIEKEVVKLAETLGFAECNVNKFAEGKVCLFIKTKRGGRISADIDIISTEINRKIVLHNDTSVSGKEAFEAVNGILTKLLG